MGNAAKKTTLEDLQELIRRGEESRIKGEESLREAQRKTEESMREDRQKTEKSIRELRETQKETERALQKASGNFNNKWGAFMESLISGDLLSLLGEWDIPVTRITSRKTLYRRDSSPFAEYDLVAYNGDAIVVVEVKTTLTREKVEKFIGKLRGYSANGGEFAGKTILGAVGYLDSDETSPLYAQREGLFVIRAPGGASGISAILNDRETFKPREF